MLSFDLHTVFEQNVLETLARQSGWCQDEEKNTIEYWNMRMAESDVKIRIVLENTDNSTKRFFYSFNSDHCNNSKRFIIPISMCKDDFLAKLMRLCGYNEDRYNSEITQYIIDCTVNDKPSKYVQLELYVPLWEGC